MRTVRPLIAGARCQCSGAGRAWPYGHRSGSFPPIHCRYPHPFGPARYRNGRQPAGLPHGHHGGFGDANPADHGPRGHHRQQGQARRRLARHRRDHVHGPLQERHQDDQQGDRPGRTRGERRHRRRLGHHPERARPVQRRLQRHAHGHVRHPPLQLGRHQPANRRDRRLDRREERLLLDRRGRTARRRASPSSPRSRRPATASSSAPASPGPRGRAASTDPAFAPGGIAFVDLAGDAVTWSAQATTNAPADADHRAARGDLQLHRHQLEPGRRQERARSTRSSRSPARAPGRSSCPRSASPPRAPA